MSYDTEEQQVEKLKEWWSENGTPLIVGAVLGLAGFFGWKYWTEKQIAEQEAASDLYLKVTEIVKSDNKANLASSAQAVKDQFPKTSYAILSAFHLAKLAIDSDNLDQAATELSWVVDNHTDNELVEIAKIRLARVKIAQDKASEAIALVNFDEDSGYYPLANLVKGDALMTLDKKTEALAAYNIAVTDQEVLARNPNLKFKIDALSPPEEVFALVADTTDAAQVSPEATITESDEQDATESEASDPETNQENEETPEETK